VRARRFEAAGGKVGPKRHGQYVQHESSSCAREAGRLGDIRSRLLFLLGALVVYRSALSFPVPGINPAAVARYSTISRIRSSASSIPSAAGRSPRLSIFAMGVMPYISASIIIQMLGMVVPSLQECARRRGGQAQDHAADALRDRGSGAVPVLWRGGRAAKRRPDERHRPAGWLLPGNDHDDHRNAVPDVAR